MPGSNRSENPTGLAFGGLVALAAAIGIGRFVYTPILPVMMEALHLSKSQAGLIASANLLGYLIGALLAAAPRLPGSRRFWLLGSLAASALTTGATGLVSSMAAFLALRFIGGAASAFVLVLASALVLDRLASAGRPRLAQVHFAGVGTGIAVSALIVSAFLAAGAGWRTLWYVVGAAAVGALAVVAWLVPPDVDGPHSRAAGAGAPQARRGLGALICAYGMFGLGYIVTATFLVAMVRASPSIRAVEPIVWLIVGLTAVPSVMLWARVASRLGTSRTFSLACLVEAVGVAASAFWPTAPGVLFAAALLGGTFMGLTALGLAGARQLAPFNPRPALARMTAAFSLGQIVGPSMAGFLFDATGGFGLPSLVAAGALIAAALIVRLVRL